MQSSKNSWPKGENQPLPRKWNTFQSEFKTPFELMGHIMRNWPGTKLTAEEKPHVRHKRLVEMIAGYPVVLSGKRPLDIPINQLSIEALNLSLYFDGIADGFNNNNSEWASLRTTLLDWDLHDEGLHDKNLKPPSFAKLHKPFLQFLIHHIETFEQIEKLDEEASNRYKLDKSNFLRALHAYTTDRMTFWPNDEDFETRKEIVDKKIGKFLLHIPTSGLNEQKDSYYEHTVKFKKIQKWIQWYSNKEGVDSPLDENARHNLLIGASAFLEGAFAKIRSRILAEKRPGSITIDGGGRISFISKNKDETDWIEAIIRKSLILNPDHEQHTYSDLIVNTLKQWGKLTKRIKETYWDKESDRQVYEVWDSETSEYSETSYLGTWISNNLEEIGKQCYPNLSFEINKEHLEGNKNTNPTFYESKTCYCCSGADEKGLQIIKTPRKFLEQCRENKHGIKDQLCAFHHILYYLGNAVKIRYGSQISEAIFRSWGERKIHHVIHLDGNGIGQIFLQEYEVIDNPFLPKTSEEKRVKQKSDEDLKKERANQSRKENEFNEITLPFWNKEKQKITDLKTPWSEIESLFAEEFDLELKNCKDASKLLKNRRSQAYLQRKRRSFNFNALWWAAFYQGIYKQSDYHLEPFVAAGDDLILVNRTSEEIIEVVKALKRFNKELHQKFGSNVPMSFGAGIAERKNSSIYETIENSRRAEISAKKSWKRIVYQNPSKWLLKESAINDIENPPAEIHTQHLQEEILDSLEKDNAVPSIIHIWKDSKEEIEP